MQKGHNPHNFNFAPASSVVSFKMASVGLSYKSAHPPGNEKPRLPFLEPLIIAFFIKNDSHERNIWCWINISFEIIISL